MYEDAMMQCVTRKNKMRGKGGPEKQGNYGDMEWKGDSGIWWSFSPAWKQGPA